MNIDVDIFKEAAWKEDFETVKRYVEAGGDVNALASNGVNALVTFNTDILEYLFQHGGKPDGFWGDNPIVCFHAWEVSTSSVQWFIEKGVNPNVAHNRTGETSLHNLTAKPTQLEERFSLIEYLLKNGADPNAVAGVGEETGNFMRDVRVVGETPLHRAAAYQSKETIQLLLDYGADKSLRDARGESAISWASRHWRNRDVLRLLAFGGIRV